jgi:hypothetical protein
MVYFHTVSGQPLDVHSEDLAVLDALAALPTLQQKLQITLVEQNRPDWAFALLLGSKLTVQEMKMEGLIIQSLLTGYDRMVARGITVKTARYEYRKYQELSHL